jgi:shikimate kinase
MEALRLLGTVVWLRGDPLELLRRARPQGARPMLDGRSDEDVLSLYRAREPYYCQAHVTVDTTGLTVDQAVARLLATVRSERPDTELAPGRGFSADGRVGGQGGRPEPPI